MTGALRLLEVFQILGLHDKAHNGRKERKLLIIASGRLQVFVFYLGKYQLIVGYDGLPLISDIVVAAKLHHQISQQAVVVGLQYPVQFAGKEVRKDFRGDCRGEYVRFVDTFDQQFDLFRGKD